METAEEVSIPGDLRAWVAPEDLREWIVETVDGLNWDNPELVDALRRHPEYEPKALLRIVAYAYLTGVFGSEDVVRLCSADPAARPIRPKLPPLAQEVSTFRKLNRGLLHLVMAQVISRCLRTQFIDGDLIHSFPPGIRRLIVESAFERINVARHMDRTAQA